jgi:hypothetical protein
MDELKNKESKGGKGLPCVEAMSKSLRLTQFFRLLKSDDPKSMGHVGFWMGNLMEDFVVQFRGMTSEV